MITCLHLVQDSRYIDFVIDQFESCAPGENLFLVEVPDAHYRIRNIRQRDKVVPCIKGRCPNESILHHLQAVFIHYLGGHRLSIISHVHPATKVFWFSWGYDLYHYCWSEEQLYLPLTYQYRQKRRKSPTERLKALAHAVLDKVIANPDHWRSAVIARTDYCSTIVPTEYPIIRALPGFRAKEVFFNYGSMESLIAAMHKQQADGDNILVGNSNSPTSNHVDAFEKIAASGLTKHKVIVPLGYGVDNPYKAFVLDRGKYYFGNRFEPLLDFLPLAEYWKIVASCQTAVFNHTRQQALGNVLITTWLGANVYLNPQNPIYSHFKNIGISLYDFSLPFALHPATTPSDVMQARERLQSEYGAEVVRNRVVELLALRAS